VGLQHWVIYEIALIRNGGKKKKMVTKKMKELAQNMSNDIGSWSIFSNYRRIEKIIVREWPFGIPHYLTYFSLDNAMFFTKNYARWLKRQKE